jgi:hypothetical protein
MNPSQSNTPRDLAKWTAKVAMILGVGQAQATNVRSSAKELRQKWRMKDASDAVGSGSML